MYEVVAKMTTASMILHFRRLFHPFQNIINNNYLVHKIMERKRPCLAVLRHRRRRRLARNSHIIRFCLIVDQYLMLTRHSHRQPQPHRRRRPGNGEQGYGRIFHHSSLEHPMPFCPCYIMHLAPPLFFLMAVVERKEILATPTITTAAASTMLECHYCPHHAFLKNFVTTIAVALIDDGIPSNPFVYYYLP